MKPTLLKFTVSVTVALFAVGIVQGQGPGDRG